MSGDIVLNNATVNIDGITVNVTQSVPPELSDRLGQILTAVQSVQSTETTQGAAMASMQEAMDRITREVQETRDAQQAAVTLIGNLAQQIRDNVGDPAALEALADSLDQGQQELGAAVVANTPSDTGGGSTGGRTDTGGGTDTGSTT